MFEISKSILDAPMDPRTFFDLSNVMMVVLDSRQRVVMINLKGCALLGYDMDEIVGKNWFDHFLPLNERKKVTKVWSSIMNGKIKPFLQFENHVVDSKGHKHLISWSNTYLKDSRGKVRYTVSSGEDVSELRKPHHCAMIACTPKGKILDLNDFAVKKLGFSRQEILKKGIVELCTPNSKKKFMKTLPKISRAGLSGIELDLVGKDFKVLSIVLSASLLKIPKPTIILGF